MYLLFRSHGLAYFKPCSFMLSDSSLAILDLYYCTGINFKGKSKKVNAITFNKGINTSVMTSVLKKKRNILGKKIYTEGLLSLRVNLKSWQICVQDSHIGRP